MGRETGAAGIDLQRWLSEFLHAEMLHTLGVYGHACEELDALESELKRDGGAPELLERAVDASLHCNRQLRDHLHRAVSPDANGSPVGRRPTPFRPGEERSWPSKGLLESISNFYEDMAVALSAHLTEPERANEENAPSAHVLGANFAFVHDPQRRGKGDGERFRELTQGRIERTIERRAKVIELMPGARKPHRPLAVPRPSGSATKRLNQLREGCAGGPHGVQLEAILEAMNEAHMWMHQAEHLRGQYFGPMFSGIPDTHAETQGMLRYCLALNTFVFVAARSTPWIFAEDEVERDYVIASYSTCCESLAPTYCMWIATQFSLLALHRRAFTYWTMGRHDAAYRDFHKLNRLLRGLRRPIERRGLRVPGTKTFIEGLGGMSEHHIGRIYRGQHAHRMALRYFKRAARRLRDWEEDDEVGPLIRNSHWRINLLINEGKANYELGRVKRSIFHYAEAWRAYLLLVESETHASANLNVVEAFIKWLDPIVDEPELNRVELRGRLEPLVDQFATLRAPPHLRLLAGDIVMRMGHLLFILKLPPATGRSADGGMVANHDLAGRCIAKAAVLDPTSTLSAADLLKIEHETGREVESAEAIEIRPLAQHWPSGSGRFEEAARITEYTLQRWLAASTPAKGTPPPEGREKIARELLGAFLAHTDSTNVKLAQVYRYLMRDSMAEKRDPDSDRYALDLLCLRRYSSFFPFLPRPSAFRAPGGGYFVCVSEPGEEPFGIAVDPGPDFIENLYRCGFALADVHMIVVTHDHADHIVSLDSMLALMGIRKGLGDPTFDLKGKRLAIVGNESVCRRYSFYNDKEHPSYRQDGAPEPRIDAVRIMGFDEIDEITAKEGGERNDAIRERGILLGPKTLRIEPVQTWGHADANGFISQGFLLSVGEGEKRSSMLFTGDTGRPSTLSRGRGKIAEPHLLAEGKEKSLHKAVVEADVVVAHLSSVPLRELRSLAGLDAEGDEDAIVEYTRLWAEAAKRSGARFKAADHDRRDGVKLTEFLLKQLQFGFRSKPAKADDRFTVTPFSEIERIKAEPAQHLYLTGLLEIAEAMARRRPKRAPLLLIGELREELGTFRTQIASHVSAELFGDSGPSALTTDIGLRVRVSGPAEGGGDAIRVLCTTCDLDNDLIPTERFHRPRGIHEVCVKGEDEGVFYTCQLHNPRDQADYMWLELVERYDVFGD